ncbi:MAG: ArsA family ATPase [Acidobacteria bacterium]|nr:ArsA family ATPase [Acidobacteriota bacterium]
MKITVFVGTGGVGKTSVAAATGLARARAGHRCLVLTIDPARRLRTALGLTGAPEEQQVRLDPAAPGELWAAMLDVRATLDEAVRRYGDPELQPRILAHPIYAAIADSLAGMQELMAVERIDQLRLRGFEEIIVDTAPSRHALEFLDKPVAFANLADSSWVKLIGRTYKFVEATGMLSVGRATMEIYRKVESILGARLVSDVLDFYSLFVSIAEGYGERARKTVAMLRDPAVTGFRVVTAPQKAVRDARFFTEALAGRKFRAEAFYVNRMWPYDPGAGGGTGLAGELIEWYRDERSAQQAGFEALRAELRVPLAALPELDRDVEGVADLERIARNLLP